MKFTIRTKILISFALLFTISILTQVFTYIATQNNFLVQLNSTLSEETNKGAGEIESFFTNLYNTSNGLGKIYQQNYNSNTALSTTKIVTATEYVLNQESEISQITYLSPVGRDIYEFTKNGEVPQDQLLYEITTNPFLSALSGEISISKVYYLDGQSGPYLDIFAPVYQFNNGNYVQTYPHKITHTSNNPVIAVIKMQISLESLSKSIGNIKVGQSGFMYVVDNTGLLIADPNQAYVLERPNLLSRKIINLTLAHKPVSQNNSMYTNENNVLVISKASEIPEINWVAVIEEPLSDAYEFIYFVRYLFWITFAGSAIFLIIIAFIVSKNITDPIKKLKENAEKIEKGNFQVSTIIESHDEVEVLSRSFDSMIKELSSRELLLKNEKKETENEKARLLASINNMPLGFILTDTNDTIIEMNQTLHKILKSHDMSFMKISDVFSYLGNMLVINDAYRKSKEEKTQQRIGDLKFRGAYLQILFSPVLKTANESIGTIILWEDITESKLLERSKDEFFAVASHELRTPLTAIRGYTSLILENFQELFKNDPNLVNMITNIHSSSIRLIKIVNTFLDASKLEQGKMVFNSQNFSALTIIQSVVEDLIPLAREKNIALTIENKSTMPDVYADQEKVKQILYNLIGNSVKFTDKGGVTVSMQRLSTHVKILVKDTGLGVSEEYRQLLFKKFQQAGQRILTRDAATGSGMGLYISKLLIEAMNGTITIEETKLNEGSTFGFTLPIAKTY